MTVIIPRHERQQKERKEWREHLSLLLQQTYNLPQLAADTYTQSMYLPTDEGGELMVTPEEWLTYIQEEDV